MFQECTQSLFYSRYFHSLCTRSVHSDCSIPSIFTVDVPGVYTVTVLFSVSSQAVSRVYTVTVLLQIFHSDCPRSVHSDYFIPSIFTASIFVSTVPGVYIVTVLFKVSSWPVFQECTQSLFYSRYSYSLCSRNVHSDCSIPSIFTVNVPGVYTVTVLFSVSSQVVSRVYPVTVLLQIFSQRLSQECTQ